MPPPRPGRTCGQRPMPELPEVEVVRRGLEGWIPGATVQTIDVLDERSLRRQAGGPESFRAGLHGLRLTEPCRRGKYLWIPLLPPGRPTASPGETASAAEHALVVHLGMSGQMLVDTSLEPDQRHLRIRLGLSDVADPLSSSPGAVPRPVSIELRFVDQRLFGGLYLDRLVPTEDVAGQAVPASVAHIARDPLDEHFSLEELHARLRRRRTGLKRALLDQSLVSGIGNIYADEALWRARLHYARPTETVNRGESARLINAVQQVMSDALAEGGTSFDSLYVNVNGASGYFDRSLQVYGRAGKPCRRCAEQGRQTTIRRERFMNRSSAFCPVCQPVPRRSRH